MSITYAVETLELSLLPAGDYLMDISPNTPYSNPMMVTLDYTRRGLPMLKAHCWVAPYNRAVVFPSDKVVAIHTPLSELSESERIDIEWELINKESN